jgi:hypothetical protein
VAVRRDDDDGWPSDRPMTEDGPGTSGPGHDVLIGYGLHGSPQQRIAELIGWAGTGQGRYWPLDGPSGLDLDTGRQGAPCVRADATMALALHKTGLAGPPIMGRLCQADISLSLLLYQRMGLGYPEVEPDLHPGQPSGPAGADSHALVDRRQHAPDDRGPRRARPHSYPTEKQPGRPRQAVTRAGFGPRPWPAWLGAAWPVSPGRAFGCLVAHNATAPSGGPALSAC